MRSTLLTLLILLIPPLSRAQEASSGTLIDRWHQGLSRRLLRSTNYVDQFFFQENELDKDNGTRIYLTGEQRLTPGGEYQNDFNFKLHLRLPQLSDYLQVSFERSPPQEQEDPAVARNESAQEGKEERSFEGAINFFNDIGKLINTKISSGVRISNPPYLFSSLRVFRDFSWGAHHTSPQLQLRWQQPDQWTQSLQWDFTTSLNDHLGLRWANHQFWSDQSDTITTSHGPSLYYTLSDRRMMSLDFRFQYANRPHFRIDNYQLNYHYRQNLHNSWFFWELSPFIQFPRSQNFKRTEGIQAKVEVILGAPTFGVR